MAINFPDNPNPNDIHQESSLGKSWIWDGITWKIYSSTTTGIAFGDLSVSQLAASGTGSLTYNNAGVFTYTPPVVGGGGSSTFIGLSDTPSSLTAGKWLKVNVGGTALEWTDAPTGNDTNDYLNTGSLVANTLVLTRTGSQSLPDVSVDLSSLNSVPTTITVADESQDTECYPLFSKDPTGDIDPKTGTNIKFNSASGQLEAGSFKKTGGTASEFLKADGSIDTTTYLSSNPSYALNDLSDVSTTGAVNGKILKYNGTSWEIADDSTGGGGGSSNFTGLADTPSSLTADKWLKVNAGGTALEWTDAPSDNNTTYDLTASDGSVATEEKIVLTGSDSSEDAVTLAVSGSLTIARSNNTITFGGGGGSTPNLNAVLGAGNTSTLAATVGDFTCDNLTVTGTTTTVNSNTVNIGDSMLTLNSDETSTPSQNGGIEIERGTSANVSLRWNETTDKWQYTNDGSNYSDIGSSTLPVASATVRGGIKLGTGLTITNTDILNVNLAIGGLADVSISGSPSTGQVLKWNGSAWTNDTDNSGADGNNYPTSFSWNSGNGVLTLNRSGLSSITVDLDGRYATGTIPTNNNQLTNGADYVTSSGTITNAEKVRIRTDTGSTMHNLVFVDSYSDNQFQVLKVDNATDSLCYNPSANRLIAQDLASFRMTSWANDYGDYGQFLMSNGSSAWEWSQYVEQKSDGELLLKRTDTSLEGGHLQFEDSDGNQAYAIDVYGTATSNSVIRVIDQNTGTQRFCVNRSGAFGIGHINADYGDSGNVLISQGSGNQPIWGSLAQASSPFATTAQGAIADTANSDIDKIYNQLNAIGNDDTITTVAELKNALLALIRS